MAATPFQVARGAPPYRGASSAWPLGATPIKGSVECGLTRSREPLSGFLALLPQHPGAQAPVVRLDLSAPDGLRRHAQRSGRGRGGRRRGGRRERPLETQGARGAPAGPSAQGRAHRQRQARREERDQSSGCGTPACIRHSTGSRAVNSARLNAGTEFECRARGWRTGGLRLHEGQLVPPFRFGVFALGLFVNLGPSPPPPTPPPPGATLPGVLPALSRRAKKGLNTTPTPPGAF